MEVDKDLFEHLLADYRRINTGITTPEDFVAWARKTLSEHPPKGIAIDPDGKVTFTLPDGRPCPLSTHTAEVVADPIKQAYSPGYYQKVY